MPTWDRTRNLPVITIKEGRQIGKVEDVIVDPDTRKVAYLLIPATRPFGKSRVISASEIHGIGDHAVTIEKEEGVQGLEEDEPARILSESKRRIIGNKMVTEDGNLLGEVRDYDFTFPELTISQCYIASRLDIFGKPVFVPAENIITIGEDAILVQKDTLLTPLESPESLPEEISMPDASAETTSHETEITSGISSSSDIGTLPPSVSKE